MNKNAFWLILAVIAGIIGAFFGPSIAVLFGEGPFLIFAALFFVALIGFIIYSLSGNRGGKTANAAAVADAKTMRPAPGKARLYVVRRGFVASMQGMNATVSGPGGAAWSGQIKSGQFLMAEGEPGEYELDVRMARGGKSTESATAVTLAAGETAVIHAYFEMGALTGTMKLTRIERERELGEINSAKMIDWA